MIIPNLIQFQANVQAQAIYAYMRDKHLPVQDFDKLYPEKLLGNHNKDIEPYIGKVTSEEIKLQPSEALTQLKTTIQSTPIGGDSLENFRPLASELISATKVRFAELIELIPIALKAEKEVVESKRFNFFCEQTVQGLVNIAANLMSLEKEGTPLQKFKKALDSLSDDQVKEFYRTTYKITLLGTGKITKEHLDKMPSYLLFNQIEQTISPKALREVAIVTYEANII